MRETADVHDGLPYLLFNPGTDGNAAGLPLIVFLHGRGERRDPGPPLNSLAKLKTHGISRLASRRCLPRVHAQDFPFVLACPQTEEWWPPHAGRIEGLVGKLIAEHGVDGNRCYLTGISMGAYGAWFVAAECPDRFAAVVPVSGAVPLDRATELRGTPVWVFLGAHDQHVEVDDARRKLYEARGPDANTILTVDPCAGHDEAFWNDIYARSYLYDWLLSHRRREPRSADHDDLVRTRG